MRYQPQEPVERNGAYACGYGSRWISSPKLAARSDHAALAPSHRFTACSPRRELPPAQLRPSGRGRRHACTADAAPADASAPNDDAPLPARLPCDGGWSATCLQAGFFSIERSACRPCWRWRAVPDRRQHRRTRRRHPRHPRPPSVLSSGAREESTTWHHGAHRRQCQAA